MARLEEILGSERALNLHLVKLVSQIATGATIHDEADKKRQELRELEDRIKDNHKTIKDFGEGFELIARFNTNLSSIERASLLSAMGYTGIEGHFHDPSDTQGYDYIGELQAEHDSIFNSLSVLDVLASEKDHPVLYFQTHGGPSYAGVVCPSAEYFFTAETAGDGLDIGFDAQFTYRRSNGAINITNPSDAGMRNFVFGTYTQSATGNGNIFVSDVANFVATTERSERILERATDDMQTNPVFVGHEAVQAATKFLQERFRSIDCDVPGLGLPVNPN